MTGTKWDPRFTAVSEICGNAYQFQESNLSCQPTIVNLLCVLNILPGHDIKKETIPREAKQEKGPRLMQYCVKSRSQKLLYLYRRCPKSYIIKT
jgi:hypothetical protein